MRIVVLLVVAVLASPASPNVTPRTERTPPYVLAYCARSARLLAACPRVLPKMTQPRPHWETSVCVENRPGCLGLRYDVLDLVDAGNGSKPPVWSHIAIYAGDLRTAFPVRLKVVGSYTWHGRRGTVVRVPAYPAGGEQGGHLVFRWRAHGTGYAVGLHAWSPVSETLAMLRVMILSLPTA
jgi:putative hemolysin